MPVKPVKIITDSVTDIPPEILKELDISIIPVLVRFGEETFRDGIDIDNKQFYTRLSHNKVMPTTAVPSLDMFARTYAKLAEETNEILVIMLSSKLSGLYNAAVQSTGLIESDCHIKVIDSNSAVMEQGFAVIKAAEAAKDGAKIEELEEILKTTLARSEMRAAFDTLEYLQRGGRIGKAQALLGAMLRVNPLIMLKDGKVEPAGMARSRAKAIDSLYNFAANYKKIDGLAVEEAACPEDAEELVKRLGTIYPKEKILRTHTSPVIGTHTGPGLLLVAVLGDK
jgi:DegV family protein with EDD domain